SSADATKAFAIMSCVPRIRSSLRNFPILRLRDPDQAPWPLLGRACDVVQVVRHLADVLQCDGDVVGVGSNDSVEAGDQAARLFQRSPKLAEGFLCRLPLGRGPVTA